MSFNDGNQPDADGNQPDNDDASSKLILKQEREARKEAKRNEKEEKKKKREETRLRNALTCDERAHVRIAASAAIYGKNDEVKVHETTTNEEGNGGDGPSATSLCSLNLSEFSLTLLPVPWTCLQALDLSHNELSELPGIEMLSELRELNLCRNNFRSLPSTLRHLSKLEKLNASRNILRPNAEFLVLLLQEPSGLQP